MAKFQVKLLPEATGKTEISNRNIEADDFRIDTDRGHVVFVDAAGKNVAYVPQGHFTTIERRGAGDATDE